MQRRVGEQMADSLCFSEWLWYHQHNESAEICGGWKSNLISHSWGGFATTINYLCVCMCVCTFSIWIFRHGCVHFAQKTSKYAFDMFLSQLSQQCMSVLLWLWRHEGDLLLIVKESCKSHPIVTHPFPPRLNAVVYVHRNINILYFLVSILRKDGQTGE